jgi:hypothetical protein
LIPREEFRQAAIKLRRHCQISQVARIRDHKFAVDQSSSDFIGTIGRNEAVLCSAHDQHGGGAPGMSGSLHHFLKSGFAVIVLANRDPGAAETIALFAAHRLPAN